MHLFLPLRTFPVPFIARNQLAKEGSNQNVCLFPLTLGYSQWKTGRVWECLLLSCVSYSPPGFAGLRDAFVEAIITLSEIYQS